MEKILEHLNEIIRRFDGNQSKAAKFIGISKSYLSQLLAGQREASEGYKMLIEAARSRIEQTSKDDVRIVDTVFRKIPVVSWTTAGTATSYEDLANQIDELVDSTTKDPNAFAIEVVGDSMEGEVHPGDRVILEPNREASSGDMAYIRFTDEAGGGGTLKWFYRTGRNGEFIKLEPENRNYQPTEHPRQMILFAYPVHNVIRNRPRRRKP